MLGIDGEYQAGKITQKIIFDSSAGKLQEII